MFADRSAEVNGHHLSAGLHVDAADFDDRALLARGLASVRRTPRLGSLLAGLTGSRSHPLSPITAPSLRGSAPPAQFAPLRAIADSPLICSARLT